MLGPCTWLCSSGIELFKRFCLLIIYSDLCIIQLKRWMIKAVLDKSSSVFIRNPKPNPVVCNLEIFPMHRTVCTDALLSSHYLNQFQTGKFDWKNSVWSGLSDGL